MGEEGPDGAGLSKLGRGFVGFMGFVGMLFTFV